MPQLNDLSRSLRSRTGYDIDRCDRDESVAAPVRGSCGTAVAAATLSSYGHYKRPASAQQIEKESEGGSH